MTKKKLRFFAIEKDGEKHLIRYYDDDVASVARQLREIALCKDYKFDHFDCIKSIFKLCAEHEERQKE